MEDPATVVGTQDALRSALHNAGFSGVQVSLGVALHVQLQCMKDVQYSISSSEVHP